MIWIVLILAFIFRVINLNQSLWLDEASQVLMSQKSLFSIVFERGGDFHPPLSYIFYHFWLMINQSEIWLRLLPVIFGVLTVFLVFKLTEKLFNKRIALTSALILAVAPYHIYYSQEIRMYSIATFFASLSMYFMVTYKPIGYVLSTAALLYTHYMGVFLILAQVIYLFIVNKKEFLHYSKLILGVFLLYLPWLPQLYQQLIRGVKAEEYLPGWESLLGLEPLKAIPLTFIKFSIGRIDFENTYVYGVVAFVALSFYSLLLLQSLRNKATKVVWYWFLMPIVGVWLVSFILPMNQPFRLLFVLPAFYILIAVGINKLGRYWKLGLLGVLTVSFIGLFIYWTNPRFHREDWKTATRDIPKNAIFAWPVPFDPYIWYGGEGRGVIQHLSSEETVAVKMLVLNQNEVYFFEYLQALSDPEKNIQKWLEGSGYQLEKTLNYNGVGFVHKYTK